MVTFCIFCGDFYYTITYQYWDDYSIFSPLFGEDCLVFAYGNPEDGVHDPCIFMETGVDLSSDAVLDLNEPADLSTVTLNLDQAGNMAEGMYDTSYGYVPVLARYTYNDGFNDLTVVSEKKIKKKCNNA